MRKICNKNFVKIFVLKFIWNEKQVNSEKVDKT